MEEQIQMICPICKQGVTKVFDVESIEREHIKCENEFYIHWHNYVYKIIDPQTPWTNHSKNHIKV